VLRRHWASASSVRPTSHRPGSVDGFPALIAKPAPGSTACIYRSRTVTQCQGSRPARHRQRVSKDLISAGENQRRPCCCQRDVWEGPRTDSQASLDFNSIYEGWSLRTSGCQRSTTHRFVPYMQFRPNDNLRRRSQSVPHIPGTNRIRRYGESLGL
jgi:hypothetical protein